MRANLDISKKQQEWKTRIQQAEKNFKSERLKQEYQSVVDDINAFKSEIEEDVEAAVVSIDAELKALGEAKKPDRVFNGETVAVLNYTSKIIQAEIANASENQSQFLKVVEEFATHEDKNFRMAFADSFHYVIQSARALSRSQGSVTGESLEGFESRLREQYENAKTSLLTPEQSESENARVEKETALNLERFNTKMQSGFSKQFLETERDTYLRKILYLNSDGGKTAASYFN